MTVLSGLVLAAGCATPVCPVVHVPRSELVSVVDGYQRERHATVKAAPGLVVSPEREPLLAVEQRVEVRPGDTVTFPAEARLGAARYRDGSLELGTSRIAPDRIESAALVFGAESTAQSFTRWNEADAGCAREAWLPERHDYVERRPPDSADPFDRRHYAGFQLGGTGVLQVAYRVRAAGRLHVDMGLFATNGLFNTSLGLLGDIRVGARTAAYVGGGGGVLAGIGESDCSEEEAEAEGACDDSSAWAFGYLRVGLALRAGAQRRDVLGFDVGIWHGTTDEGPGGERGAFTWPMAGFSYHWAW